MHQRRASKTSRLCGPSKGHSIINSRRKKTSRSTLEKSNISSIPLLTWQGALELESTEIRFELNSAKDPVNIIAKKEQEINKVVAEFMIFANMAVAQKIYSHYPSAALLRHHPMPRSERFEELIKCAASKGFTISTSSNKSLSQSLALAVVPEDPAFNQVRCRSSWI